MYIVYVICCFDFKWKRNAVMLCFSVSGHSRIVMSLQSLSPICLAVCGGQVWLWASGFRRAWVPTKRPHQGVGAVKQQLVERGDKRESGSVPSHLRRTHWKHRSTVILVCSCTQAEDIKTTTTVIMCADLNIHKHTFTNKTELMDEWVFGLYWQGHVASQTPVTLQTRNPSSCFVMSIRNSLWIYDRKGLGGGCKGTSADDPQCARERARKI